ncbi:hypothetical protein M3Y99_01450900 [Aphelenchoides fujianensis]|nr:hypothetical protein M3Y99_01450900 [Aphelenchoides fujianensis]
MNTLLLLFVASCFLLADGRIYNLLGCHVAGDEILECDGTTTKITAEHEAILNDYMSNLAAYYRGLYAVNPNVRSDTPPIVKQPEYPRLCKRCDDPNDF